MEEAGPYDIEVHQAPMMEELAGRERRRIRERSDCDNGLPDLPEGILGRATGFSIGHLSTGCPQRKDAAWRWRPAPTVL